MAYLPASATKNGDEVYQPLPSTLAKALGEWLPTSTDNELWPTNWHLKAAKMIRVDLETAKIEPETAEGVINFHSLRVSYCTALARAGVPPTIAQKLMRHSTIQLTLETYTKFTSDEVTDALDKLA
jgi:integrase